MFYFLSESDEDIERQDLVRIVGVIIQQLIKYPFQDVNNWRYHFYDISAALEEHLKHSEISQTYIKLLFEAHICYTVFEKINEKNIGYFWGELSKRWLITLKNYEQNSFIPSIWFNCFLKWIERRSETCKPPLNFRVIVDIFFPDVDKEMFSSLLAWFSIVFSNPDSIRIKEVIESHQHWLICSTPPPVDGLRVRPDLNKAKKDKDEEYTLQLVNLILPDYFSKNAQIFINSLKQIETANEEIKNYYIKIFEKWIE